MEKDNYPVAPPGIRLRRRKIAKATGSLRRISDFNLITANLLVLGLLIALQFLGADRSVSLWTGVLVALASLAFAIFQMRSTGFQWASAPVVYLTYMAAYHLLFVTPYTIGNLFVDPSAPYRFGDSLSWWVTDWINTPGAQMAIFMVATACIGFATGSVFAKHPPASIEEDHNDFLRGNIILFRVGVATQFVSIFLFWSSIFSAGGYGILAEDYTTFRGSVVSGTAFSQTVLFLGVGAILALAGAPRRFIYWPFIVFALVALPLFFTGNRGEVLYPLLTLFVLLYRRGIILPRVIVFGGILAVFLLVPIVFEIRTVGLGQVSLQDLSFEVERAFIDLGFSLRPVTTVANWILGGDQYLLGGSFWLPFERMLAQLLPFIWERGTVYTDVRFVAYQANFRTGAPMGFSVVAEAFYNFSFWGPPLVLGIIGFLLAWLHWNAVTPIRLAILGVVLFPLINQVRNTFIFVPFQVFVGLSMIGVVAIWPYLLQASKTGRARKRAESVGKSEEFV